MKTWTHTFKRGVGREIFPLSLPSCLQDVIVSNHSSCQLSLKGRARQNGKTCVWEQIKNFSFHWQVPKLSLSALHEFLSQHIADRLNCARKRSVRGKLTYVFATRELWCSEWNNASYQAIDRCQSPITVLTPKLGPRAVRAVERVGLGRRGLTKWFTLRFTGQNKWDVIWDPFKRQQNLIFTPGTGNNFILFLFLLSFYFLYIKWKSLLEKTKISTTTLKANRYIKLFMFLPYQTNCSLTLKKH